MNLSPSQPRTDSTDQLSDDDVQHIERLQECHSRLKDELAKVIVGQKEVIEQLVTCLFARGHALADGRAGTGQDVVGQQVSRDDVA